MILMLSTIITAFISSIVELFISSVFKAGRNSEGQHECQISEGGEDNLDSSLKNCTKKAGHSNFIPFNEFRIEHLPEKHRNEVLYKCIKALGILAVRVGVNMVSTKRPEFWPNTNDPYPFGNIKGSTKLRSGSGETYVLKFIDGVGYDSHGNSSNSFGNKIESEYKTCPCENCKLSDYPSTTWWEIFVHTAAHVVFDDIEARYTRARLFYDEQVSEKFIIDDLCIDYVDINHDYCVLNYVTCRPWAEELYEKDKRCSKVWNELQNFYRYKSNDNLCFIVSHPHGCIKKVSIGHWVTNEKVGEMDGNYDVTKLTYTTVTCPGSNGARIFCVGYGVGHVHRGSVDSELNYSTNDVFEHN